MVHIFMGFYLLIGMLVAPAFMYLEKAYFFTENRAVNATRILLTIIFYYFLWPITLIYYAILLIKLYH